MSKDSEKKPLKLTAKQEKFAQNIIQGMTQSDAYRDAYDAENMQYDTIWSRARDVRAHSKVSARIDELRAEIQREFVKSEAWNLENHVKKLTKFLEEKPFAEIKDSLKSSDQQLKALEQLCAIYGFKEPEKSIVDNRVSVTKQEDARALADALDGELG